MFPCCHLQGAVHLFARSLKRRRYQQMAGAGDRPAGRGERLVCRRVCDGERGRQELVESAATCRATSSIWMDKVQMSSPDNDTRATQGGVTSAIISARWATSFKETCACVAIMARIFGGGRFAHKVRRKSVGTDGPSKVRRCRRNWVGLRSPISSCIRIWRTRCSSDSDRRLINSLFIVITECGWGAVMTSCTSAAYLFST